MRIALAIVATFIFVALMFGGIFAVFEEVYDKEDVWWAFCQGIIASLLFGAFAGIVWLLIHIWTWAGVK